MKYEHIPVMLKEVLEYLDPKPGNKYIDCTLGGGGYSFAIAKIVGDKGFVVGIDMDDMAISNAREKIKEQGIKNIKIVQDNFGNLTDIINGKFPKENFDGIVMDLGLSSAQLDDRNRGISFKQDAPLDMAFGGQAPNSTIDIVNNYSERELENIIRNYGEEKFAKSISRAIVSARMKEPIKRTGELLTIIENVVPLKYRKGKIHFATRTFQALRIETNGELENLKSALRDIVPFLNKGGRIVVVSYHSLEDRIVKHFFKDMSLECICPPKAPICNCDHQPQLRIITKKIITPTEEEMKINIRARSAKMRVAEKI